MRRIMISLLLCLLAPALMLSATQIVPIEGLKKADSIQLDDNQIYFRKGATVYIYSQKDFKLLKEMGKPGDGKGEFKVNALQPLNIDVTGNEIVAVSLGKISRFSKRGELISETKFKPLDYLIAVQPFENGFVGQSILVINNTRYRMLHFYNGKMKQKKELARWKDAFQQGKGLKAFHAYKMASTYDGKVFLADGNEFKVDVLDPKGKTLYSFQHQVEKLNVTPAMQSRVISYLKTSPETKPYFENMKPILFADYLPAIRAMMVKDGNIYVLAYEADSSRGNSQWYIFDLKGKLLREKTAPMKYRNGLLYFPFTIHKNKLYQIVNNYAKEILELHITDL